MSISNMQAVIYLFVYHARGLCGLNVSKVTFHCALVLQKYDPSTECDQRGALGTPGTSSDKRGRGGGDGRGLAAAGCGRSTGRVGTSHYARRRLRRSARQDHFQ